MNSMLLTTSLTHMASSDPAILRLVAEQLTNMTVVMSYGNSVTGTNALRK